MSKQIHSYGAIDMRADLSQELDPEEAPHNGNGSLPPHLIQGQEDAQRSEAQALPPPNSGLNAQQDSQRSVPSLRRTTMPTWSVFVAVLIIALLTLAVALLLSNPQSKIQNPKSDTLGFIVTLALAALLITWLYWRLRRARLAAVMIEQKVLRESEERFRSLVQNVGDLITILHTDGTILYQSPSAEEVLGYTAEELVGKNILDLLDPEEVEAARDLLSDAFRHPGDNTTADLCFQHKDGSWVYLSATYNNLLDNPSVGGIVLTARDISEHKIREKRLTHQALHDPLTNLPNRVFFIERLDHALSRALSRSGAVAVLFLDLDNFKVINDSLGHNAGDHLLIEVGHRLKACIRREDTVARLGGDEFTILLEDITGIEETTALAERIAEHMEAPFFLDGHEIFITASIGISRSTTTHDRPDDLLRDADVAMYDAKNKGKARYAVFDPHMNRRAWQRLEMEAEMRRAIERGEFRVYYQPVVQLANGRLSEVEALVRWEHPQRGLLTPAHFIPLAEETGLIVPIGQQVLEEACRQVRLWQPLYPADQPLMLSVNLSARQFQHPKLVQDIADALQESGFDPRCLKLEITESIAMGNSESTIATLWDLKDLGIRLAVDDFGTGYSALSYLKRCPVDTLKIDRSFVDGLGRAREDMAIVRAVIAFANALNLSVTAEGIETAEQLSQLQTMGCDYGQGFYFARPLAHEAVSALFTAAPVAADKEPSARKKQTRQRAAHRNLLTQADEATPNLITSPLRA